MELVLRLHYNVSATVPLGPLEAEVNSDCCVDSVYVPLLPVHPTELALCALLTLA